MFQTETKKDAITSAIAMIAEKGPKPLLGRVNFSLEEDGVETITREELTDLLTAEGDPNDSTQVEFRLALSRWDQTTDSHWLSEAPQAAIQPKGRERRAYVLSRLGFSEHDFEAINSFYPVINAGVMVANPTDGRWPWYSSDRRARSHYWDVYQGILKRRGFDPDAIVALDESTTQIVSRFADPTWDETYQAKGLVVGHVQSGKTANFTGTVAKAIDAGYRLIIVLTGTLELLRSQTQRRLDKELVGFENIVGGIDLSDEMLARETIDYIANQDADWLAGDKFVKFGYDPESVPGVPHIIRLTKSSDDYKSLRAGLSTLDYKSHIRNPEQKIYHPDNLWDTPVRLVVIKKNATVLRKLIKDLKQIRGNTQDYPALIIDDEADQAGINTKKPPVKLSKEEQEEENKQTRERTAINKLLSELLGILPRSQYVGYTATPFANVFIDASDVDDIYPKDFIFSLTPPDAYMGGRSFHDRQLVLGPDEEKTPATSNQAAYVRDIRSTPDMAEDRECEMQRSVDSFVLSGVIKLWREARGSRGDFKHHTMLFHESVKQVEHNALADEIHRLWKRSDYLGFDGYDRLAKLWEDDYSIVMQDLACRTDIELPDPRMHLIPSSFDDVAVYLPEVIKRVENGLRPIAVVNGDKDSEYTQAGADFQKGPVWKILVGGAKLSRGYTIEGLTVTWYSRKALAADTLMQMGRWFGYRPGYRDLVRLYIGRNVPASAKSSQTYDLYEAFESIIGDEEEFRDQLEQFAELDENGQPQVRPIEIPPLVSQSLPWLRPTARSRMYNAQIVQYAKGDRFKDFFYLPPRHPKQNRNRENLKAIAPVLRLLTNRESFEYKTVTGELSSYKARAGLVPAQLVVDALRGFAWSKPGLADADIKFVEESIGKGSITHFKVVMPIPKDVVTRMIDLDETGATDFPIIERKRRARGDFSGSSRWTRQPLEKNFTSKKEPNDSSSRTTGAVIVTLAADQWGDQGPFSNPAGLNPDVVSPEDIATLFSWALPHAAAPKGKAGFSVLVPDRRDEPTVEAR
ncbi:Z1 domain-containing protein [Arthrobacter sp. zg-Y750]|uniref:Z1 domain-containing protein n=1 Tax=Arthrobacter sp. zg-Y750 TaxID=2894189 RepID=UPI001E2AAEAD|nr:Z1 domain-containing protein [Arthrobacter sp. zg-Y750]MCC9178350.1 Z1 domain-containing protein [Arthrobacter sp. zg-Y750]